MCRQLIGLEEELFGRLFGQDRLDIECLFLPFGLGNRIGNLMGRVNPSLGTRTGVLSRFPRMPLGP
jgi:hypothetical protein